MTCNAPCCTFARIVTISQITLAHRIAKKVRDSMGSSGTPAPLVVKP